MSDQTEGGLPDVQVSLRQAFAKELAARLPRLEALRATRGAGPCAENADALRDVHTLASSAVIIGEARIAELAREVERDPVRGPVDGLVEALQRWSA